MTKTKTKPWLTWSECLQLCEERGITRYQFMQLAKAVNAAEVPELTRRYFPGCKRARYSRSSLLTLIGAEPT